MVQITESGITLILPDNNYFRFQDCDAYKKELKAQGIREMDICWYDQKNNILYLIEFKDWGNNKLKEEDDVTISKECVEKIKKSISEYRIKVLFEKSLDSCCMLVSILFESTHGKKLKKCMPFIISKHTKIILLSVIDCTDPNYIAFVNDAYRSKFKSYSKLFGIKEFMVLTKQQASQKYKWITNGKDKE